MRTRGDIKTSLTRRLLATDTSTYFTPTAIEDEISNAHIWAADDKSWPSVKRGFLFDTSGDEYYDYPDNCQTESVFRISVNGDSSYKKKDFEEYLDFIEKNPNSTEKIWSEYGRQIFIFPVPDEVDPETYNGVLWGLVQATKLTNDNDLTIFSDWADSVNEAILLKAFHDLTVGLDPKGANDALAKAQAIINKAYLKIAKRNQRKQQVDKPMFDVPDFFGKSVTSSYGNFSIKE